MSETTPLIIYGSTSESCPASGEEFKILLPPEKLTFAYTLKYKMDNPNTTGRVSNFEGYDKAKMNFSFVIDGTGVTGVEGPTVAQQIEQLDKVTYKFETSIHRPRYLHVKFGSVVFKGEMLTCNVEYTLFKFDGTPLRAKVTMSIQEFKLPKDSNERKMSSPDLTHLRFFKDSDNVFNYCKEIYDDPNHYIQIAQVNEQINFRKIDAGQMIIFPPFEKA